MEYREDVMLTTWNEARRVLIALLLLSLAGLATACDSITGPQQTPSIEFDDAVMVEDDWVDDLDRRSTPTPIRKGFEE